jgi:hypothetical protein
MGGLFSQVCLRGSSTFLVSFRFGRPSASASCSQCSGARRGTSRSHCSGVRRGRVSYILCGDDGVGWKSISHNLIGSVLDCVLGGVVAGVVLGGLVALHVLRVLGGGVAGGGLGLLRKVILLLPL